MLLYTIQEKETTRGILNLKKMWDVTVVSESHEFVCFE